MYLHCYTDVQPQVSTIQQIAQLKHAIDAYNHIQSKHRMQKFLAPNPNALMHPFVTIEMIPGFYYPQNTTTSAA